MLQVTATNLPRLLACNGSRLLPNVDLPEKDNTVKDEGNAADWVIKQVFSGQHLLEELIDRKAPNGVYITPDMAEHLETYLGWIEGKGLIEENTNYNGTAWSVAGRTDHVWFDERSDGVKILNISDFKYGWKIVEPDQNWTLISHAIGYTLRTGIQPTHYEFKIFQPRPYHPRGSVRVWRVGALEFEALKNSVFGTLDNLNDEIKTGEHCYKCPSRTNCPAAMAANMNSIDVAYNSYSQDPTEDELEFLITQSKRAMEVLKQSLSAYEDTALSRLQKGTIFKNYVAENNVGNEVWQDNITPEFVDMIVGKTVSKKVLPTPKQVVKMGVPEEVVKTMTERKNKGFKLVRSTASEQAKKLFN